MTMPSAERHSSPGGTPRTASSPAIPPSSRRRSSRSLTNSRFVVVSSAGADSIASTEQKVAELRAEIDLNRDRFVSLDFTE